MTSEQKSAISSSAGSGTKPKKCCYARTMMWNCARRIWEGTVTGTCRPRQRHSGFLTFPEEVECSTPGWCKIHLIVHHCSMQYRSVRQNTLAGRVRQAKFGFIP
jgi:hypothetical protein